MSKTTHPHFDDLCDARAGHDPDAPKDIYTNQSTGCPTIDVTPYEYLHFTRVQLV